MTDELKFYDPETGKPLYRAPEGATIPRGTPYGIIESGKHRWRPQGSILDWNLEDSPPCFTREPIAPPAPPLPTEPGYYIDKDGDLWRLNEFKHWKCLASIYNFTPLDAEPFAPFSPASIVPTETWDRLRVLDPEDTRDRIGAGDTQWRWAEGAWRHVCDNDCRTACSSLEGLSDWYGPLRFADEVSDR